MRVAPIPSRAAPAQGYLTYKKTQTFRGNLSRIRPSVEISLGFRGEKDTAGGHRVTSLIGQRTPLGLYRGPVPRINGGSWGGGRFWGGEVPL